MLTGAIGGTDIDGEWRRLPCQAVKVDGAALLLLSSIQGRAEQSKPRATFDCLLRCCRLATPGRRGVFGICDAMVTRWLCHVLLGRTTNIHGSVQGDSPFRHRYSRYARHPDRRIGTVQMHVSMFRAGRKSNCGFLKGRADII